ncbi:hypothetical protein MTP10_40900 [Nonomuraea sp. 3-1Str]|uniref:hypothetical protein n=1 Tax=Nonomuraea sp. 3-1Str TaxID=2929801 RepID=UPI0028549FEE|nr:hypothetical protein [Nonomuraea sp. 3-1Str]MDR8415077.1 hypothetical protein [Nonomuraea sp. 3-1Str]
MTTTSIPEPSIASEEIGEHISEVEAIGALLARLPLTGAPELLELARSCPLGQVAASARRLQERLPAVGDDQAARRWMAALERLRARLVDLVAAAYEQASAAEAWLNELDAPASPNTQNTAQAAEEPRTRRRRASTGPANRDDTTRPVPSRRTSDRVGPNEDEARVLVRKLCERMASSDSEAAELIAMLDVG